jgi:hypothetical protein
MYVTDSTSGFARISNAAINRYHGYLVRGVCVYRTHKADQIYCTMRVYLSRPA